MRYQSRTISTSSIPYASKPSSAFCSITFKSLSGDPLSTNDFFQLRDILLTFLLPYGVQILFPFGFVRDDQMQLMICFECNPSIESYVHNFIYITNKLDNSYKLTYNFDVLD